MKKLILIFGLATLLAAHGSWAQVAAPNDAGVSMGSLHLLVQDVDAYRNFFLTLGGVPAAQGTAVKFPGVIVFFTKGEPDGGTVGSVVNHFAFSVPKTPDALAKWNAAGLKTEVGNLPGQGYVHTPDDLIRIEILENPSQTVPVAFHHVHFFVADPAPDGGNAVMEIQAWYAKVFGAIPGKRGNFDAADIPGANLTFGKSRTPVVPTNGRVLDRIGFEVKHLEGFCKKETTLGVKFDSPCTKAPGGPAFSIFITDPWGTKIELTNTMSKM